jgi:murein DD-endopeptidase MepM/ murein hydrolase activator NlpD
MAAFLWPLAPVTAQESTPQGPVYIVQAGDSLWDIAIRFGVSLEELSQANGIEDPNQLTEGMELVIPGLEGIQGRLVTSVVGFGESLESLSRRLQVPPETLARLNHIISPTEIYAGYNLVAPESEASLTEYQRIIASPDTTLLELSALAGANPWELIRVNNLKGSWEPLPGDTLLWHGGEEAGPSALPGAITDVEISPLYQGRTAEITISTRKAVSFQGSLMGHPLNTFRDEDGKTIALQGIHAMAEPGLYPLSLQGQLESGARFEFTQNVLVQALDYPFDRPLTVDPATIDPAVTQPEDAQWAALAEPVTPRKLWSGKFHLPSPLPEDYCLETGECWTSSFGNRRSYNGSPYDFFHTGLDIAGGPGTDIIAPAAGVVVFAGPMTVRGNTTLIDHGLGVYSGYMHQSEILVEVGDEVTASQVIGKVGGTGRVEGPHLHWEMWVGGVRVDPIEWLEKVFP